MERADELNPVPASVPSSPSHTTRLRAKLFVAALALIGAGAIAGELYRSGLGLAAAVLVAAGAAALSWLAAHFVSESVRALTHAVRRMAQGDFGLRTGLAGDDDLGSLGSALDQLARNLSVGMAQLRAERDLLNSILASMAEGVLLVGGDGRILLINPALRAMLLVTDEAEGRYVLHVIRNADLSALIERARSGESPEMELELAGLRPRRVLVRAAALRSDATGVLAVFVDVTELRHLESVRRDFVTNASHELRSPLTAIRAAAETLAAVQDDPPACSRFVELIRRNSERLQSLVDDMLELARIESRELQLQPEAIDLPPVLERVVAHQAHRAQLKEIAIHVELSAVPQIRVDRRALEHVLVNLLDNAIKYCPVGSKIELRAQAETTRVRVEVADDGPGIAAEHLPRLFERFYRVDPGRSRELGGTGLGLAIVKHLVEAMGGIVTVKSRPGAGTTFSFTLPKAS